MAKLCEGTMAFDSKQYDSVDAMMKDVAKVMTVLTENEYAVAFRYEDVGIYILEYGYEASNKYGAPGYMWVTAEEFESVLDARYGDYDKDED